MRKQNLRTVMAGALVALAMMVGMMALLVPPKSQAQTPVGVPGTQWLVLTNVPAQIAGNFSSNMNSVFELRNNQGVALLTTFACSNASGSNVIFNFQVSADGTNYTTSSPYTWTLANNGTTAVTAYTNWTPLQLNNVRFMKLTVVSNVHLSTLFLTNIVRSYLSP